MLPTPVTENPMPFFAQSANDEQASSPSDALVLEADLVRQTVAGDRRAFDEIVRLHTRRLYNFLYHMTRHRQDAEDLVQLTFVKAYHNLHRFDLERPLANWLLTIARRTALNHFRSAKRWETLPETLRCSNVSPAHSAEESDATTTIWSDARRLLSQREFEVLWLRFGENLSTRETARVMGITQPHVKILVYRARNRLMKALKKP